MPSVRAHGLDFSRACARLREVETKGSGVTQPIRFSAGKLELNIELSRRSQQRHRLQTDVRPRGCRLRAPVAIVRTSFQWRGLSTKAPTTKFLRKEDLAAAYARYHKANRMLLMRWEKMIENTLRNAEREITEAIKIGPKTQDASERIEHLKKLVDERNINASFQLGYLYLIGEGVLKDDKEAARLLRSAAENGNALAQYTLARMLMEGSGGLDRNVEEALRFAKLASDQGLGAAHLVVARYYETGNGTDQEVDVKKAYEYYKKISPGQASSYLFKHAMHCEEAGYQSESQHYMKIAADEGHPPAIHELFTNLLSRAGEAEREISSASETVQSIRAKKIVADSTAEALKYLRKGVEINDAPSKIALGWMLWEGKSVERDVEGALKLFTEASIQEDPRARFIIGSLLAATPGKHVDAIAHFRAAATTLAVAKYSLGCILLMTADINRTADTEQDVVTDEEVDDEDDKDLPELEKEEELPQEVEAWTHLRAAVSSRVLPAVILVQTLKAQKDQEEETRIKQRSARGIKGTPEDHPVYIIIKMSEPISKGTTMFVPTGIGQALQVALGDTFNAGFIDFKTPDDTIKTLVEFAREQEELAKKAQASLLSEKKEKEPRSSEIPTSKTQPQKSTSWFSFSFSFLKKYF